MSTTKTRINICAPKPILNAVRVLARRDDVPVATKTLELVKQALLMEEDYAYGELALLREKATKKWISHGDAWKVTK